MLKKPPRVRDNNGALQVRLRLDGQDHFINRLGRFDDPVAQARGHAICTEIWRDAQQADLDLSLNRYRPLVGGIDQDLLDALRSLVEEKKQALVTHAYRVVKRFGLPIRTNCLRLHSFRYRLVNDQPTSLSFLFETMYIAKNPSTNVSFDRREVNVFRQMEEALMCKTRLIRSGCYKVAMEDFYCKHFPRR